MSDTTHRLNIVVTQNLSQATTALNSFGKTAGGLVKSQDALNGALGKTEGAAIKLSTGFTKTGKAAQATGKQTQSLGQAFKSSSMMIAAFASSLVNTYQQVDSLMDQEMKLNRMRATLDKQTTQLSIAEANLKKKYDEGKISGESYRLQSEKLASQRAILAVKEEQYADAIQDNKTAWLSLATTVIPTVLTGFSSLTSIIGSLKGTLDTAGSATNVLATAKKGLHTAVSAVTTAFTPFTTAIKNLIPSFKETTTTLGAANSTNTVVGNMGALNTAFVDSEKSGNIFIRTFEGIGKTVKTFFTNMAKDIKNSEGIVNKIAAGFKSFFSQLGSGFSALGGKLKQLGSAIVAFGKQLLMVFVHNPVLIAITAMTVALTALIFNIGGFRDRLNEIGVALGKWAPWLKPILDGLGWFSKQAEILGNTLMGTQTEITNTGNAAALAAAKLDPFMIGLSQVVDVGKDFSKLNEVVAIFANVRAAIADLSNATDDMGKVSQEAYTTLLKAAGTAYDKIIVKTAETDQAYMDLIGVITKASAEGWKHNDAVTAISIAYSKLSYAAGGVVTETVKQVKANQDATAAAHGLSDGAYQVAMALAEQAASGETVVKEMDKNVEAAIKFANQLGVQVTDINTLTGAQDTLLNQLVAIAPALETMGSSLAYNADKTISFTGTITNLVKAQEELEQKSTSTWSTFKSVIDKYGVAGLKAVEQGIVFIEAADKELGASLRKTFDEYKKQLQESGKHVEYLGEVEKKRADEFETFAQKEAKAISDTKRELSSKAEAYQVYNQLAGKALVTQQTALDYMEEEKASYPALIASMQKLALQRGIEGKNLEETTAGLLQQIKTNKLAPPTIDEINKATADLIAKRQEDVKASKLELESQTALLKEMGRVAPIANMSGKALGELNKIYDDSADSMQIATDKVGLWWAELEKSQKAEEAEKKVLLEFAKIHKIDIPQAIEKGSVEGIKKYIAEVTGMADATEEQTKKIQAAFDELTGKSASAWSSIIDEDLLKGDLDEVINKLADVGASIDQLSVKQAIIKPLLDTVDFEDGVDSLQEILMSGMGEMQSQSREGANQIMQQFTSGLYDTYGSEIGPVVDTINSTWQKILDGNPAEKSGKVLLQQLMAAVNQPSQMAGAVQTGMVAPLTGTLQTGMSGLAGLMPGLAAKVAQALGGQAQTFSSTGTDMATAAAEGFKAGGHLFATAGEAHTYTLIASLNKGKAEAWAATYGIAEQGAAGYESGADLYTQAQDRTMQMLLDGFDPATKAANKKAAEIAKSGAQGLETGAKQEYPPAVATTGQILDQGFTDIVNSMHGKGAEIPTGIASELSAGAGKVGAGAKTGLVDPINENIMIIPNEAEKSLAPVEGAFGTAFEKASVTTTQKINSLADVINSAIMRVPTTAKTYLGQASGHFDTFSTDTGTAVDSTKTKVGEIGTATGTASSKIGTDMGAAATSMNTFKTATDTAIGGATTKIDEMDRLTRSTSTSIGTNMGAAGTSMNSFKTTTTTAVDATTKKVGEVDTAMKTIPTSIATNLSTEKMSKAWDGFHTSFAKPTDNTWIQSGTKTIGTDIGAQIKTQAAPWWQPFYDAFGTAGAWISTGIGAIGSTITTNITSAASKWWVGFQKALYSGLQWVTSGVTTIGAQIANTITTGASKWWVGFQTALGTGLTWVGKQIGLIGSAITTAITPASAVKWWKNFQDALGSTATWVNTGIKRIGEGITTAIAPASAVKWWKNFQDALGSTATWVGTGIKKIGEGITTAITPANAFTWWKNFQNALGDTKTWVDTSLKKVGAAIKGWDWATIGNDIWKTLTAGWGAALDSFISGATAAAEGFTGALTGKKAAEDENPMTKPGRLGSPPQISESAYYPDAKQTQGATGAISQLITQLYLLDKAVLQVQKTFSGFSTSISTYASGMTTSMGGFLTKMGQAFPLLDTLVKGVHTSFSSFSTSVTTYASGMTTAVTGFTTSAGAGFTALAASTKVVHTALSSLSTSVSTYASGMTTAITGFSTKASSSFTTVATSTKTAHTALSSLSTSVSTYSKGMSTAVSSFATSSATSFGKVATSTKTAHTALSTMSTSVSTYMSGMSKAVTAFGNAASTAFGKVKSQADTAAKSVNALAKAINALKSKTINIHVGITGPGAAYLRHGGSGLNIPSESGFSYAAAGKTWIQKTPKTLGSTHVAESFPEIISAIPLDPKEKMSPFHDLKMDLPVPVGQSQQQLEPLFNGGGGGQPITVSGNLNITVRTASGKVLAQEVQPYLLEDFGGTT